MAVKKGGLGRGLESLFNENSTDDGGIITVKLNDIEPNSEQPRKDFDEVTLSELAESISEHGLIQPIVVKPETNGRYSIIAGERRWRACRIAGLYEVPVIVKDVNERELTELALIENLQREDLNPVEEALGYRSLIENFKLTQEQVAKRMGKSRVAVTNALRLLNLDENELSALRSGEISAGHARTLLTLEDKEIRAELLKLAIGGASVRELEKKAASFKKEKSGKKQLEPKNKFYSEVEISLKETLRRKVEIVSTGKGKGKITLEFFGDEELSDFARRLAE